MGSKVLITRDAPGVFVSKTKVIICGIVLVLLLIMVIVLASVLGYTRSKLAGTYTFHKYFCSLWGIDNMFWLWKTFNIDRADQSPVPHHQLFGDIVQIGTRHAQLTLSSISFMQII